VEVFLKSQKSKENVEVSICWWSCQNLSSKW